jgi:hypothetical protein
MIQSLISDLEINIKTQYLNNSKQTLKTKRNTYSILIKKLNICTETINDIHNRLQTITEFHKNFKVTDEICDNYKLNDNLDEIKTLLHTFNNTPDIEYKLQLYDDISKLTSMCTHYIQEKQIEIHNIE